MILSDDRPKLAPGVVGPLPSAPGVPLLPLPLPLPPLPPPPPPPPPPAAVRLSGETHAWDLSGLRGDSDVRGRVNPDPPASRCSRALSSHSRARVRASTWAGTSMSEPRSSRSLSRPSLGVLCVVWVRRGAAYRCAP